MNHKEYNQLICELEQVMQSIPNSWGKIQNNKTDAKVNLFTCSRLNDLTLKTKHLSTKDQQYFKFRWFLWQCSRIDEYLFYSLPSNLKNPNSKDYKWDVQFKDNPNLQFDIKSTVVPKKLISNFKPQHESELISYYYQHQSKGVRKHYQNRLFIVHHSYINSSRSFLLRSNWTLKQIAFQYFNALIPDNINFIKQEQCLAKCIFIIENKNGELTFHINEK